MRQIVAIASAALLVGFLAVGVARADDHDKSVTIVSATVSADQSTLIVKGSNFGTMPSVTLDNMPIGGIAVSGNGKQLTGVMPALPPGSYLLVVKPHSSGHHRDDDDYERLGGVRADGWRGGTEGRHRVIRARPEPDRTDRSDRTDRTDRTGRTGPHVRIRPRVVLTAQPAAPAALTSPSDQLPSRPGGDRRGRSRGNGFDTFAFSLLCALVSFSIGIPGIIATTGAPTQTAYGGNGAGGSPFPPLMCPAGYAVTGVFGHVHRLDQRAGAALRADRRRQQLVRHGP